MKFVTRMERQTEDFDPMSTRFCNSVYVLNILYKSKHPNLDAKFEQAKTFARFFDKIKSLECNTQPLLDYLIYVLGYTETEAKDVLEAIRYQVY